MNSESERNMSDSIYIYGASFSTLVRSVMLCSEEKGIDYAVGAESEVHAGCSVQGLNPFDRIPILLHHDFYMFETGPICRYLDQVFDGPKLQGENARQNATVDQWTQALNTTIDEQIVRKYLLEFAFPKAEDGSVREDVVAENSSGMLQALAVIEAQLSLSASGFFCSEQFSTADALLIPMLHYLNKVPTAAIIFGDHPKCFGYIQKMQQRPSGKKVLLAFDA